MSDQQKKEIGEMVAILETLSPEELYTLYGYAQGLQAKRDTATQPGT